MTQYIVGEFHIREKESFGYPDIRYFIAELDGEIQDSAIKLKMAAEKSWKTHEVTPIHYGLIEHDGNKEEACTEYMDYSYKPEIYGMYNKIGFDPDKHRFVCHKCHGTLLGVSNGKSCGCISGWIRPEQQYHSISSILE